MSNWMKILLVISVLLGFSGMLMIIIDAMTVMNVVWGWISLICIILGIVGILALIILLIIFNKDKIKASYNKYK